MPWRIKDSYNDLSNAFHKCRDFNFDINQFKDGFFSLKTFFEEKMKQGETINCVGSRGVILPKYINSIRFVY